MAPTLSIDSSPAALICAPIDTCVVVVSVSPTKVLTELPAPRPPAELPPLAVAEAVPDEPMLIDAPWIRLFSPISVVSEVFRLAFANVMPIPIRPSAAPNIADCAVLRPVLPIATAFAAMSIEPSPICVETMVATLLSILPPSPEIMPFPDGLPWIRPVPVPVELIEMELPVTFAPVPVLAVTTGVTVTLPTTTPTAMPPSA